MNGFGHTINSDAFDDWREVQAQRTASAKPMIVACILAVALLAVGALAGTQHAQWALESGYLPDRKSVVAANPMYKEHPWKLFLDELEQVLLLSPSCGLQPFAP